MRSTAAVFLSLWLGWAPAHAGAVQERLFELNGNIVQSDGKPLRARTVIVFLQSVSTNFCLQTSADSSGSFKLKNLRPGTYLIIIGVPMRGEMIRTVEIGPSFADSKDRMKATFTFEPAAREDARTVSAAALSVPESAKNEYQKARDRLARNDTAGAIAHLKKAVELAPQFSAALNNLGTIAYRNKNYAEAEDYFRKALEQDPDAYSPLVNLGGALLSGDKFQEALEFNLLAVRARPDSALARSQLGQNYMYLDQIGLAEMELKKAKALDPGHFSFPQLVLAEIYMRRQEYSLAAQEVEEFIKLHPDSDRVPNLRSILQELRAKKK